MKETMVHMKLKDDKKKKRKNNTLVESNIQTTVSFANFTNWNNYKNISASKQRITTTVSPITSNIHLFLTNSTNRNNSNRSRSNNATTINSDNNSNTTTINRDKNSVNDNIVSGAMPTIYSNKRNNNSNPCLSSTVINNCSTLTYPIKKYQWFKLIIAIIYIVFY
jgi:hypothetical protein